MFPFRDDNIKAYFWDRYDEWLAETDVVSPGQWYHIAVTWHYAYGVYIYLNGHLAGVDDTSKRHSLQHSINIFSINSGSLYFGCGSCGGFTVDNLKIQTYTWNKERIANDIGENE